MVMSTLVSSNPSSITLLICTLSFGVWSFIEVCQNTWFLFLPWIFDSSFKAILPSRVVQFFTISTWFHNGSGEDCPPQWLGMPRPVLTLGPSRAPTSKEFPDGKGLPHLSLVDLHPLVQCRPLPYLLHNPECWGLLLWVIPRIGIISWNVLSTVSSQMAYSTTIKAFGILISPHIFEDGFSYPNLNVIIKICNIGCVQNPFIHWYWSDL